MASSQLLGDHGAWADWIGYGPSTQPIGGLAYLWDYAGDDAPAGSTSIFPDHTAGRLLSMVALAGLIRRERTGRGGHATVAQAEAVANMVGDLVLAAGLAPGSIHPTGNRRERGAPWGAYPCAGEDQWVAITVRDDADWSALRQALGDPEWMQEEALSTAAGRHAAHDAIDAQLEAWTAPQSKRNVTATLQMFGVPAAPMFTPSNQIADPHYQVRRFPRWLDQQGLGWMAFEGPPFHASGMEDIQFFQAPLIGEHTRAIARDLLGLGDDAIQAHIDAGILEITED